MTKKIETRSLTDKWGAIVDCCADLLGSDAEVVLHDVSGPEHSVIMIRNGHVTGRSVGAPLTDLGFFMLRESEKRIDTLGVYHSRTADGKLLKCNAANLRNEKGAIEAILCINIEVTRQEDGVGNSNQNNLVEHYWTDPSRIIKSMLADARREANITNGNLSKEQIFTLVRALDAKGVFRARGAVKEVSKAVHIAIPTVYKYIRQTRTRRR